MTITTGLSPRGRCTRRVIARRRPVAPCVTRANGAPPGGGSGEPSVEEFSEVTARPCSDPHQYELFWIGSMGAGDYPGDARFEAFFERVERQVDGAWWAV